MANRTLPKHIRWASHTLNLIVMADVQKALKDRALFEFPASPKHVKLRTVEYSSTIIAQGKRKCPQPNGKVYSPAMPYTLELSI